MRDDYQAKLGQFVDGCNAIIARYYAEHGYAKTVNLQVHDMRKYTKLISDDSAYCFVEKETGDVFKAAGFKTPAKHARGNIYDEHNGLSMMGPHGPAYLR
jgi:hypothetical protein